MSGRACEAVVHCPHCGHDWSKVAVVRNATARAVTAERERIAAAVREQHHRVEVLTQDGDDWIGCICGEVDDDCAVLAIIRGDSDAKG